MIKKLIACLMVGLTMVGFIGCGEAPIDVNEVTAKFEQIGEIAEADMANIEVIEFAKENNLVKKVEYQFTDEEMKSADFKEFSGLTESKIKVMDNEQLKVTNALLDTVLEMGTNDEIQTDEVKYSSATRNTMIDQYSAIVDLLRAMQETVNELDTYKMHPEEMVDWSGQWNTVALSLIELDQLSTDLTNRLETHITEFEFEEEVFDTLVNAQKAFHEFVEQYPNEQYPRAVDSETLRNARNRVNTEADKAIMWDIRQFKGVMTPSK